jgi:hypothetical protein
LQSEKLAYVVLAALSAFVRLFVLAPRGRPAAAARAN